MINQRRTNASHTCRGAMDAQRCSAHGEPERRGDAGFSLIELIVGLGIFTILMMIVTAISVSALGGISEARQRSELQAEAQNAMEAISRLLKYADVPAGRSTAIENASSSELTVYTYSGTGQTADVPYRARIFVEAGADDSRVVVSEVTEPTRVGSEWSWAGTGFTRQLLSLPASLGDEPLSITYWACDPKACEPSEVTPTGSGPVLDPDSDRVLAYLVVAIGDPNLPEAQVRQTIELVNLR